MVAGVSGGAPASFGINAVKTVQAQTQSMVTQLMGQSVTAIASGARGSNVDVFA